MVADFDDTDPRSIPSFFLHLGDMVYRFGRDSIPPPESGVESVDSPQGMGWSCAMALKTCSASSLIFGVREDGEWGDCGGERAHRGQLVAKCAESECLLIVGQVSTLKQ